MSILEKATELQRLHAAPELLLVVNVWDIITRDGGGRDARDRGAGHREPLHRRVLRLPGRRADPRDLMVEAVGRIAAATDLPVSADLEAGYGDPAAPSRAPSTSASSARTPRTR